ncbi:MAG: alpha/beta hydrolase [Thermoflexales bacterium]
MNRYRILAGAAVGFLITGAFVAAPASQRAASEPTQPSARLTLPEIAVGADHLALAGSIDIGGRSLYLACYGKGEPTIVLDGALWSSGEEFRAMLPELMRVSRTCFYSRPNTWKSQSDPVMEMRTSKDMVSDLHALLGKAGLKPPYVLGGSAFGALNLTLYAAEYPNEVAGLALNTPVAPGMSQAFLDLVPASMASSSLPARRFRETWENYLRGIVRLSDSPVDARVDGLASEKQILGVKTLGDLPIHLVRPSAMTFEAPDPTTALKMEQIYFERLDFFAKLSTKVEQSVGRGDDASIVGPIMKLVDKARGK